MRILKSQWKFVLKLKSRKRRKFDKIQNILLVAIIEIVDTLLFVFLFFFII